MVTTGTDGLTTQWYGSFSECLQLQNEWDDFVLACEGDIYMTFDWCRIWWEQYGSGRSLQIAIVRDQHRLVAVIPLFTERISIGPISVRVCRLVGADHAMTLCTPAIHLDHVKRVLGELADTFVDKQRCDLLSLGPMIQTSPTARSLVSAVATGSESWRGRTVAAGVCTVFDLPETFEAYLAALPKKRRGDYRREWKRLSEDQGVSVDERKESETIVEAFDEFVRMHQQQWRAAGKLGHFDDWPAAEIFNKSQIAAQSRYGRVSVMAIRGRDGFIAGHYVYHFGGKAHWRLTARVSGEEWDRRSIGGVSLVRQIASCIEAGVRAMEGGFGHYDYKLQWGGRDEPVVKTGCESRRWMSRLRLRVFIMASCALDKLYYRGWFQRIAPRLPLRRRGLWTMWIRSRI